MLQPQSTPGHPGGNPRTRTVTPVPRLAPLPKGSLGAARRAKAGDCAAFATATATSRTPRLCRSATAPPLRAVYG